MTDEDAMRDIGERIRAIRVGRNVTVPDLARRTNLNQKTVMNAEAGRNPRLATIVRVLRALGRLDALDAFLPVPALAPLDVLKRGGKPRRRAWTGKGD